MASGRTACPASLAIEAPFLLELGGKLAIIGAFMALDSNTATCRLAILTGGALMVLSAGVLQAAEPLAWQTGEGYRSSELRLPASGRTFLQRLPAERTGISFSNFVSEGKGLENSMRLTGGGVAAGDVDGDGWCDLFLCGLQRPCALYRNLGNWRFEDVTASAG